MGSAGAESLVAVGVAADVEPGRIVERLLVAVARREPGHHLVAGLDRDAAELRVARRRAAEVRERRDPTDELLDRGRDELAIGTQALVLVGVLDQRQHPAE